MTKKNKAYGVILAVAILVAVALILWATSAFAGSDKTPPGQREDGSWGEATSDAISKGFDQGGHASSFAGDRRQGLANAGGKRGDLSNTADALGLEGDGPDRGKSDPDTGNKR